MRYILFFLILFSACQSQAHDHLITEEQALALFTEQAQTKISFPFAPKKIIKPVWVISESFSTEGTTKATLQAKVRIHVQEGRLKYDRVKECPIKVTFGVNLTTWLITSAEFEKCVTLDVM
jgi:hypothetical protein